MIGKDLMMNGMNSRLIAAMAALLLATTASADPRTLNDGVYAYADVADPFLAALGEALARELA